MDRATIKCGRTTPATESPRKGRAGFGSVVSRQGAWRRDFLLSIPALAVASGNLIRVFFALVLTLCALQPLCAATNSFRSNALKDYREAVNRTRTSSTTNRMADLVELSRACFDLAEFATNNAERALVAEQGIESAQKVVALTTNSAAAHYYLGMNLGQLARTRTLGALKLVGRLEKEFLAAAAIDPRYDHAGPHRNLGLLYRDAPSIGSVGSRSKARHHLQRAVVLAPDYPENRIGLIEAYLAWGDTAGVEREWKNLQERLPAAKRELAGERWASSWVDWDKRLASIKSRVERFRKSLHSPRAAE